MPQRFAILGPLESLHGKRRYLGRRRQGPGLSRLVMLTRLPRRLQLDVSYLAELSALTSFRHRNVAAVLELQTIAGELFLTHEFTAGASLFELEQSFEQRGIPFPPGLLARMLHDAALALDEGVRFKGPLGNIQPVTHRELSGHALVASFDGQIKIVDFGHPRQPAPSQDGLSADLQGLERLMRFASERSEGADALPLEKLAQVLRPEAGRPLPSPKLFAEALAREVGVLMWSEEAVANFVRRQFPRRLDRMTELAFADPQWTLPEVTGTPARSPRPATWAAPETDSHAEESSPPPLPQILAPKKPEAPGTRWVSEHLRALGLVLLLGIGGLAAAGMKTEKVKPVAPTVAVAEAAEVQEPSPTSWGSCADLFSPPTPCKTPSDGFLQSLGIRPVRKDPPPVPLVDWTHGPQASR